MQRQLAKMMVTAGFALRRCGAPVLSSRRSQLPLKGDSMVLGLSIETFTLLHVVISLVGIVTGIFALAGMLRGAEPGWMTHVFLITTALTTLTGFLFPITAFTPALGTGIVSTALLIPAFLGLYVFHLGGAWRWIYAVTATAAFYLNTFVLVVQAFQKVPPLAALAPTQSEMPFVLTQGALLLGFLWLGYRAVMRFRPPAGLAA